ncbi:MAG: hypothetical protein BIFFINMI_03558 [Phycisphaerae bacterium]|nr:hypothetical protein [Phycisphaerae bacterium]
MIAARRHLIWAGLIAAVALAAGAAPPLACARYGIGMTPDSVIYLTTADSLAHGRGLVDQSGSRLTIWPPLYPALVAAPTALGMDVRSAAVLVNALLAALLTGLGGAWAWQLTGRGAMGAVTAAMLAVADPVAAVSSMAWSELPFLVLVLLFCWQCTRLAQVDRRRDLNVLLLALAAGAACLARYIGMTLIAAGAVALLVDPLRGRWRRVAESALFSAVACGVLAAWLWLNYLATGHSGTQRWPGHVTLGDNLVRLGRTMVDWFLPLGLGGWIPGAAALVVLGGGLIVASLPLLRRWWRSETGRSRRAPLPPAAPLLLFIWVYLGAILLAASRYYLDPLGDRLLCPIAVPLTMLVVLGLDSLTRPGRGGDVPRRLGGVLALMLMLYLAGATLERSGEVRSRRASGAGGFNTKLWHRSASLNWLRDHRPDDGDLISNGPDAVWVVTGQTCDFSPRRGPDGGLSADRLARFNRRYQLGPHYLFWLDPARRESYLCTPEELAKWFEVTELQSLGDGRLYRIAPRSTPAPSTAPSP